MWEIRVRLLMKLYFNHITTLFLLSITSIFFLFLPYNPPSPTASPPVVYLLFGNDQIISDYASNFLESLERQLRKEGVSVIVYRGGQSTDEQLANSDFI